MRQFRFALLVLLVGSSPTVAADPVDYRKDIKPILRERCYACHGALKQNAKLRVDSGAALIKAEVVVPGKPDASELISRVSSADLEMRMPPEGHALKPEQIAKLRVWIEQGAKVPADDKGEPDPRDHWAFRPPVKAAFPTATRNPIDSFIQYEWQRQGLKPQLPAEKRVLLRRVHLDLIGLPPTAVEYDAFVKDNSPDAYEKVVDRLLASPQYGERWGRHFLDIWRYSDWWGLGAELRNSQKHIWHWRDWTVECFNADVGYDEMLRQMLAADEIYPTDMQKIRATGYLARSYFLFNRTSWLDEVTEHTSKGFMGLTFNCAKCHDHKYDPTSQLNFYQFRAVFEPYQVRTDFVPGELDIEKTGIPRVFDCNLDAKTPFHIRGDERNADPNRVVTPGLPAFLAPDGLKIDPVKLPLLAHQPGMRPEIVATYRKQAEAKLVAAKEQATKINAAFAGRQEWLRESVLAIGEKPLAAAEAESEKVKKVELNPNDPALALRGAIKSKENNLETDANRLKPFPDTSTGRRKAFALWLTDRKNPLAARVAVNHIWTRHFGKPLVPTVFDFGRKGTPPTHPELLDWLAVELMEKNWSLKHLHKLMVTSNVYRLSSSSLNAAGNAKMDSENKYLWRMNSQRMQAQTVRDGLLHLAGDLDLTMGGPSVLLAEQDASRRRSMYFFHSHNEHNKFLGIFDDANVLECYRRTESIVPQQALALSNSKFALSIAEKINDKLHLQLGSVDDAAYVKAAFETILGTNPKADETAVCLETLKELQTELKTLNDSDRTKRARLQIMLALVNHNDFVSVR
jgi:mono/diheme cytochrome c family protein